jgi:hypothetical protein
MEPPLVLSGGQIPIFIPTIAMECLYKAVSNKCSGKGGKEHILQECVGGTLTSEEIICVECNRVFGEEIDTALRDFYLKIIIAIAPSLPSGIRKQKIKVKQSDGVWLEITPGSQLRFTGTKFIEGKNAIITTPDYDGQVIQSIFKAKHGRVGDIKIQEMPISSLYPMITYPEKKHWQAYRAAVKAALNFLIYFEIAGKFPGGMNRNALAQAISFAYTDKDNFSFGGHIVPFIDFSDRFGTGDIQDSLSHKFIVCHSNQEQEARVFFQLFNSFSWYFVVPVLFNSAKDFSFVYSKAFIPERKDSTEYFDFSIISAKEIRDRKFVGWSESAVQFATIQFEKSLEEVHGFCTYYSDLNYSEIIRETIRVTALKYENEPGKREKTFLDLVDNRYSGHPDRLDVVKFVGLQLATESISESEDLYERYKKILPEIRKMFGLPQTLVERKIGRPHSS